MLDRYGFEPVRKRSHRRLVVMTWGQEKTGKTHFAMTAPGPIAVVSLDAGTQEVVEKLVGSKEIYVCQSRVPPPSRDKQADQDEYKRLWREVRSSVLAASMERSVRTVVIDTATELWELCRLAAFGRLTQVLPVMYGPVNKEFRDLVKSCMDRPDLNLVFIHKVRKSYQATPSGEAWNGQWEAACFQDMPYLVDVEISHSIVPARGKAIFRSRVESVCRQNPDVFGLELDGEANCFPVLASMVYPDSDPSEWQ